MATSFDMPPDSSLTAGSAVDPSITPPHSANGKKEAPEGVPAELSDLELDPQSAPVSDEIHIKREEVEEEVEEIEDIEPDHYYGDGGIPVFKPVSQRIRSSLWCHGAELLAIQLGSAKDNEERD